ncbi:MAG: zinc protease [Blastocatellia bacterium]|jgi:zinc protease|nr:zinc protease [Blastocatellia bacterium]
MKNTNLKTKSLMTLLALVLFAVTAAAQVGTGQAEVQTTKGAVLKGRAPVNKTILKVKRPKAGEAILTNGLHVMVLESSRVPTFSMEMVVMSGGLSDPADMRGLANATASLLREGTAKHNSKEIAEQLDTMGASIGANSGLASFTSSVTASGLVENFDQVLDLFTEVVRTPTFPATEVERYKSRTLSSQPLLRGQAGFLAQERLNQAIYGTHPASLVLPPAEAIKKITPADLVRFHAQNYLPNNAMLAIVGDVKLKDILPKLERAFGDWKSGPTPQTSIPAAPAQSASKIFLINRPGSVQTVFQIGSLAIDRNDPDYPAMAVMNRILGGGGSSRLFLNIREDKSYAYSVGSNFNSSKYRGTFVASSPVRTEATEGALREFMNEFNRIRNEQVSPTELENAKRAIVGNFALSLENSGAILQNIITQKLYGFPADYWDTYPQKIEAVTAEDVQRVARKYIDLDHLQIVAVGDAAKAKEALAKFGTVVEYDGEGKPMHAALKN